MSRIGKRFEQLKAGSEKALICFLTAGDPDIRTTRELVLELERAGADIVELGVPFSDPLADGPSIQAASHRALDKGTTVADVLTLVADIRRESEIVEVLPDADSRYHEQFFRRKAGSSHFFCFQHEFLTESAVLGL